MEVRVKEQGGLRSSQSHHSFSPIWAMGHDLHSRELRNSGRLGLKGTSTGCPARGASNKKTRPERDGSCFRGATLIAMRPGLTVKQGRHSLSVRHGGARTSSMPWAMITVPFRPGLRLRPYAGAFGWRLPDPFGLCASAGSHPSARLRGPVPALCASLEAYYFCSQPLGLFRLYQSIEGAGMGVKTGSRG